jgi:hypothetical protein
VPGVVHHHIKKTARWNWVRPFQKEHRTSAISAGKTAEAQVLPAFAGGRSGPMFDSTSRGGCLLARKRKDAMEEAKKSIPKGAMASWLSHLSALEHALSRMKKGIEGSISAPSVGTTEWSGSVEKIIDELTDAIYALKTPGWADAEQSERVKRLKRNAQEVYAKYLRAAGQTLPG